MPRQRPSYRGFIGASDLLTGSRIPDPRRSSTSRDDDRSIGAVRHGLDVTFVFHGLADRLPGAGVPDRSVSSIASCGYGRPVGTVGHGRTNLRASSTCRWLSRAGIPEPRRLILPSVSTVAPSGLYATALTVRSASSAGQSAFQFGRSRACHGLASPVSRSHRRGCTPRLRPHPVFHRFTDRLSGWASQSRAVSSSLPVSTVAPSGLYATARTARRASSVRRSVFRFGRRRAAPFCRSFR